MTSNIFPAPPTTTNALEAADRTRLLRSTRKLGAVLGTTPFLLETKPAAVGPAPIALKVTPTPLSGRAAREAAAKRSRRNGSIFEMPKWDDGSAAWTDASPRSSMESTTNSAEAGYASSASASLIHLPLLGSSSSYTSSDDSDAPTRSRGLAAFRARTGTHSRPRVPAPLRLHVVAPRADPRPSLDDDELLSYPRAPLSPLLAATPATATPPSPAPERAIDARVRKMAKLARHLGERVPQELVFPDAGAPAAPAACPNPSLALGAHARTGNGSPLALVSVSVERVADRPAAARKRRSLSLSIFPTSAPAPLAGRAPTDAAVAAARYAPLRAVAGGARTYPAVVRAPIVPVPSTGERGTSGWVGEWNRDDMRQVRDGLRALKGR